MLLTRLLPCLCAATFLALVCSNAAASSAQHNYQQTTHKPERVDEDRYESVAKHSYDNSPKHDQGSKRAWSGLYFELLMRNPFGKQEGCRLLGAACTLPGQCCDGGCDTNNKCCKAIGQPCTPELYTLTDPDCCTGACRRTSSSEPFLCATVGRAPHQACLAGEALVHTLESPTPVPLKDVRVGQHIQCLDTDDDLRLPSTPSYCEVLNFVHAISDKMDQHSLRFTRPDGSKGVTPSNFVIKLEGPHEASPTTAAAMSQLGQFQALKAEDLKVGDKVAVLVDANNPAAGFTAATVTEVQQVLKQGTYLPAINKPYVIADGVVTPLWMNHMQPVEAPTGVSGADQAVQHYLYAPLWMTRLQALGTSGAAMAAQPGVPRYSLAAIAINDAKGPHVEAGKALSYKAVQEWFRPRYAAWKADPAKAITLEDVMAYVKSDAPWVQAAA